LKKNIYTKSAPEILNPEKANQMKMFYTLDEAVEELHIDFVSFCLMIDSKLITPYREKSFLYFKTEEIHDIAGKISLVKKSMNIDKENYIEKQLAFLHPVLFPMFIFSYGLVLFLAGFFSQNYLFCICAMMIFAFSFSFFMYKRSKRRTSAKNCQDVIQKLIDMKDKNDRTKSVVETVEESN